MLEGLRRQVLTSYGSGGWKTMVAALQSEKDFELWYHLGIF